MTTVLEPGSELDPSGGKTHNLCTDHILFNRLWCPRMYRKMSHIALAGVAQWLKHWPAD